MSKYNVDVLIIGSGPVGIFAAYQARFLGMTTLVVDALNEIGGQLNALYPYKKIYDIPGFPEILAKDLIENLKVQAANVGHEKYIMNTFVKTMSKLEDGTFEVGIGNNELVNCKAIIIAAGAGAFGPNRPPLSGIEELENKSVFYFVQNPEDFRDKVLVIAGGGDTAVDWTVGLANLAKKIYVIHRRDNFRAAETTVQEMRKLVVDGKVELVIPYQLSSLGIENEILKSVEVKTLKGDKKQIECDILLPFFGLSRDLGNLVNWGLELDKLKTSIVVKPSTFETSVNGIFAVGDVSEYEHKLKLISVGFAEAVLALHKSWEYVFPNKAFHFEHSTTK